MNRRKFIQIVGTAGAGAVGTDWSVRRASDRPQLRIAVVGCGRAGTRLARMLHESGEARVVAAIDPHRHRAGDLAAEFRAMGVLRPTVDSNLERVVSRRPVDGVVLAVPDHRQAALLSVCVHRRLPVLARAPVAHGFSEYASFAALPADARVHVALAAPVDAGLATLRQHLADGAIGRLERIAIKVARGGGRRERPAAITLPPPEVCWPEWCGETAAPYLSSLLPERGEASAPGWRWHLRYGNGLLGSIAPHWFAAVAAVTPLESPQFSFSIGRRVVLGRPRPTEGAAQTSDAPDHQLASLRFENVDLTWEHRLLGRRAAATLDRAVFVGTAGAAQLADDGRWSIDGRTRAEGAWIPPSDETGRHRVICAEFLSAIRGQRRSRLDLDEMRRPTEWILWSMAALQARQTLACEEGDWA